jgi:hypothetical protein
MRKFLVTSFFLLVVAAPSLAKPRDVYPVSCDDLWAAVKLTLNNQSNYSVLSMDDLGQRAAFTVVGELTAYTDRVALRVQDSACAMNATIDQVGADNVDWRQFHHRLAQALAKLQAAKPKLPMTGAGPTAPTAQQ